MQDLELWRGQIRNVEEFESGTEGVWRSERRGVVLLFATSRPTCLVGWMRVEGGVLLLLLQQY